MQAMAAIISEMVRELGLELVREVVAEREEAAKESKRILLEAVSSAARGEGAEEELRVVLADMVRAFSLNA